MLKIWVALTKIYAVLSDLGFWKIGGGGWRFHKIVGFLNSGCMSFLMTPIWFGGMIKDMRRKVPGARSELNLKLSLAVTPSQAPTRPSAVATCNVS